ncbi:MAG TPA: hypothetical protein PLD23_15680 [Armatimonadota bacterium]|nr:hypothetical protein [Armatimonadota bacterium]
MSFAMTEIGGVPISRLMIGTNTFHGFSHFSGSRDRWLRQYFTPERIYEVLEYCVGQGLNATIGMQRKDYADLLDEIHRNTGTRIHYIATPGGGTLEELKKGIREAADLGCEFCWPHTSWTDVRVLPSEGRIVEAPEAIAYIRECGMIPGWSTHRPETIVVSDHAGYDVAGYVQILNSIGFLCQVETDWCANVIRGAQHPCVCIKPLGAGRVMPATGLAFAYENCKPNDTVVIGMMSVQEAEEDIEIARACIERREAQVTLQVTRSKAALVGG